MASDTTFEGLWKRLLVHSPNLPVPLAQEFINTAYSRILASKEWSSLRANSDFYYPDPYSTGTITVAQGATTVGGSGTAWTTSMIGRQLMIGSVMPFYDIIDVDVSGQTLTLDRTYAGAAVSNGPYTIKYVYILMPSDLMRMLIVIDPSLNWKLRLDILQSQLDMWDPKRSCSGTGWVLAPATPSPVTATLGRPRMELWPAPSAAKLFTFRYEKRPNLMSAASDVPIYPVRGDVIREGALTYLSMWPGLSVESPNPYFGQDKYKMHKAEFEMALQSVALQDEDLNRSSVWYDDYNGLPWAPIDAQYFQQHDVFL